MGFARILILAAAGLWLAACTGSGDGGRFSAQGGTNLEGALVCLDLNANLACDESEPQNTSDELGRYSLNCDYFVDPSSATLAVATPGKTRFLDNCAVDKRFMLASGRAGGDVTVFSSLAFALEERGVADPAQAVKSAFDLGGSTDIVNGLQEFGDWERKILEAATKAFQSSGSGSWGGPREKVFGEYLSIYDNAQQLLSATRDHEALLEAPPPANSVEGAHELFYADLDAMQYQNNMQYGSGIDEAAFNLAGNCSAGVPTPYLGLCANVYNYTFQLVESKNELSKHLELGASAKASVSVAGFDLVSVSGKLSLLKDAVFKDDSLYIIFKEEMRLCNYPARPAVASSYLNLFTSDYDAFRASCGDRYLSSITTGGYFVGLVEVRVAENTTKDQMKLKLAGEVAGITVYSHTWKETLNRINQTYGCVTRVDSNMFKYSSNLLGVDQVFELYDQFAAHMADPVCSGQSLDPDCAYQATFSRYETIIPQPPANVALHNKRINNMKALEVYYVDNQGIIDELSKIYANPSAYNIGGDVDSFHSPNDWSQAKIATALDDARKREIQVVGEWNGCYANLSNCNNGPAELGLPDWIDLKEGLPQKKFILPSSCQELSDLFGVTADDARTLYFGGILGKSYPAFCQNMTSSTPATYIELFNTTGNPEAPSYNYSSAAQSSGGLMVRSFKGLHVENKSDAVTGKKYLSVVKDLGGYSTLAQPTQFTSGIDAEKLSKSLVPLSAFSLDAVRTGANLNLAGTKFHISPLVRVRMFGSTSNNSVKRSTDGKDLTLSVTGSGTGGCLQAAGDILLEMDE